MGWDRLAAKRACCWLPVARRQPLVGRDRLAPSGPTSTVPRRKHSARGGSSRLGDPQTRLVLMWVGVAVLLLGGGGILAATQYHSTPTPPVCTRGFEGVGFQVRADGPNALSICSNVQLSNTATDHQAYDVSSPDTSTTDVICVRDIGSAGQTTRVTVRDSGFVPSEGETYCGNLGGTAADPHSQQAGSPRQGQDPGAAPARSEAPAGISHPLGGTSFGAVTSAAVDRLADTGGARGDASAPGCQRIPGGCPTAHAR